MHGGIKVYRGSAAAARHYLEADGPRVDDYYLAEGTGLADHYLGYPDGHFQRPAMDGDTYERWVAGYDVETGKPKGRLRSDDRAVRFVEVVVNGPKTWSLARGAGSGDRGRLRRRPGPPCPRGHRLAGSVRHHPDRAPRAPGPGPRGCLPTKLPTKCLTCHDWS